jgi:hypothetical protein
MVFFGEKKLDTLSDDELRTLEAATHGSGDTLRKSGHFTAALALQSLQAATAMQTRHGVSVTDGPFAETNEQIGGAF